MTLKNKISSNTILAGLLFSLCASVSASAQITLPPPPAPYTPNATVAEDVVVRVNDQIITRSDMTRSQTQLEQELRQANASPEEITAREKNLLRDQIDQQLLLSKGKELDVSCDAEVVKQLDELRKQNHLDSMEDLERAAQQQNVSYEDLKASIRNNCLTQKVVQQEVGSRLQLSHADVIAYYNAHQAELTQPESIRLSEILIPVDASAPQAAVDAAQAKANAIEDSLKGGAKFADVAKQSSGGPTAAAGGDLGVYKRGALAAAYEDATFKLEAGQYSAPIRTKQGFVILDVTQHVHAGVPDIKTVEEPIQEAIYSEKMQPALRAYLTKLREEAYIDPAPGFIDTGASPNEMRPVNSAYVPPAPKVKKSVVRKQEIAAQRAAALKRGNQPRAIPAVASVGKNGKPKKIKREKVRYGQSPRENLPVATDRGGDLAQDKPAQVGPNAPTQLARDASPSPLGLPTNPSAAPVDPNADPLAPKAVIKEKSRFSQRPVVTKQVRQAKTAADTAAATPNAPTQQESIAKKFWSTPLGLNGDTAKTPKKPKPAKKERFEKKKITKEKVDTSKPTTAPVQPVKP
jgi:peptidyl-prolyl cis-trans isomerase SurA